jgi:hypothetical protein
MGTYDLIYGRAELVGVSFAMEARSCWWSMLLQLLEEGRGRKKWSSVGAKRLDGTGHAEGTGCHTCDERSEVLSR